MTARPVDVILLGGAPGSGKTTTLDALRPLLPNGVVIDLDTVWSMLCGGSFSSERDYATALRQAVKLALGFLADGRRPVVIAAPFDVAALPFALALFEGVEVRSIALVCEDWELRARLTARPAGFFRDVRAACDVDQALRGCASAIVNTSWHTPEAAARRVVLLVEEGLHGRVKAPVRRVEGSIP